MPVTLTVEAIDRRVSLIALHDPFDVGDERCQAGEGGALPEHGAVIAGGIPRDRGTGWHIADHATLCSNAGPPADGEMVGQPGLAGEEHVILYGNRAGDPYLRHDDTVPTDTDIVGYLHQVVDLGALADLGIAGTAAVDRAVGADLHPVANGTPCQLWYALMPPGLVDEAEARTPHPRAGADRDIIPEARIGVHSRPGADLAPIAEPRTCLDDNARTDAAILAKGHARSDHRMGVHSDPATPGAAGTENRGRMYSPLVGFVSEDLNGVRDGSDRMVDDDGGTGRRDGVAQAGGNDHGTGAGGAQRRLALGAVGEREIPEARRTERGDPGEGPIPGPDQFAANEAGDGPGGDAGTEPQRPTTARFGT